MTGWLRRISAAESDDFYGCFAKVTHTCRKINLVKRDNLPRGILVD